MKLAEQRCQCPTCGQGFNRVSTFDKHRIGDYAPNNTRRCLSTEEMQSKGWQVNAAGFWITASGGWSRA